jgi:integrase
MIDVHLRYIYRNTDRHGNERIYFRRRGTTKVRMREPLGSPEFMAHYAALLSEHNGIGASPAAKPATLHWLCEQYFRSAAFRQLEPRTQHVRRLVLEKACQEPTTPGSPLLYGEVLYTQITKRAVRVLRDRKLDAPESGNARVKALRQVFAWALEEDICGIESNPAREVSYLKPKNPDGHHTWTPEEVLHFEERHPIGTRARLALDLMLYTGIRRSDAVVLGRQHQRAGKFRFTQAKNKSRKPKRVVLPVLDVLQRTIDASEIGDLAFLVTEFGLPFTPDGFGNWFRDRCIEAGVPGRAHGLRKAGATLAAHRGATTSQLKAIFAWSSLKEAERYTQAAEQERLAEAARHLLDRDKNETETRPTGLANVAHRTIRS